MAGAGGKAQSAGRFRRRFTDCAQPALPSTALSAEFAHLPRVRNGRLRRPSPRAWSVGGPAIDGAGFSDGPASAVAAPRVRLGILDRPPPPGTIGMPIAPLVVPNAVDRGDRRALEGRRPGKREGRSRAQRCGERRCGEAGEKEMPHDRSPRQRRAFRRFAEERRLAADRRRLCPFTVRESPRAAALRRSVGSRFRD